MIRPSTSLLIATLLVTLGACKKKDNSTDPVTVQANETTTITLVKLGETNVPGAGAKAIVHAGREPEIGYNELFVAFQDSIDGTQLSNGQMTLNPKMDMGSMQHGAPTENSADTSTSNGYFKVPVIFTMSGNSSQWSVGIQFINRKNGKTGLGVLPLAVKSSSAPKFRSTVLTTENNTSLYICLVNPLKPKVGINDIEIVLHKKVNAWEYQPVNDYSVEIEPTMPSMGHGSPNNVNPVITANGHYKGKVNFTMSGLWQIKLKFFKNGVLLSEDQYFEITI